jgi:hypothetical protein
MSTQQSEAWRDAQFRGHVEREFEREELEGRLCLQGRIDSHIHIAPEITARRTDAVELAKECRDQGMRAIVIKPFEFESVTRAYFAEKMAPGIKVLGGLTLGSGTGGLNPAAVEKGLQFGAKGIWLPIFDTVHMQTEAMAEKNPKYFGWVMEGNLKPQFRKRHLVTVQKEGKLLPEMKEIMHMVAEAGAFLGTSHISPEESLLIVNEAQKIGLRISATHVNSPCIEATEAQVKEMAKKGAFVEFCFVYTLAYWGSQTTEYIADLIRAAGPEHSILVSDGGQTTTPTPPEQFKLFIRAMKLEGFSDRDIDLMTKDNPAKLLGL